MEILISLTDEQDAYARALIASGRFASVSAVLQRGLELVNQDAKARAVKMEALQQLIEKRRDGNFVPLEDSDDCMAAVDREG